MENGEIWLVELPKANGHEQSGSRPAVVLAEISNIVVIIPVTSNLLALKFPFVLSINPSDKNGLTAESAVLVFQIRAIDRKRLTRKIGRLEKFSMKSINELLCKMLNIK